MKHVNRCYKSNYKREKVGLWLTECHFSIKNVKHELHKYPQSVQHMIHSRQQKINAKTVIYEGHA